MRGTRPYRHICLPPLVRAGMACSYCLRSQPRRGTPQQAHACSRSFRHWTSLCTVIDCPDTQRILPPPGAKLSDVQFGRHVDLCQRMEKKKSNMIASCSFLEEELRQCSKEEGVTMADSVEQESRGWTQKKKARRKMRKVRFSIAKKNKVFQRSYMKVGIKKLLRAGMVPTKTWRVHAVEMENERKV